MASTSTRALRYVAGTKKAPLASLYLQCRVKPGASKSREGVTGLTEDAVEICVAAPAREGEANKAVIRVLSEVRDRHTYPTGTKLVSRCHPHGRVAGAIREL